MKMMTGLVLGFFVALFPPSAMAKDLCLTETPVSIGGAVEIVFKAYRHGIKRISHNQQHGGNGQCRRRNLYLRGL